MAGSLLDQFGREIPGNRPPALPLHFKRPPSLQETIRQMVGVMSRDAESKGFETFEEAEDFDVDDDDPRSPHELDDEQDKASFKAFKEETPIRAREVSKKIRGQREDDDDERDSGRGSERGYDRSDSEDDPSSSSERRFDGSRRTEYGRERREGGGRHRGFRDGERRRREVDE